MAHVYGVDGYIICILYEEKRKIEQTVRSKSEEQRRGELHTRAVSLSSTDSTDHAQ